MATKTITLEIDAYDRLKHAKRPGESFSAVVRRASWDESTNAGQLLAALIDLYQRYPESFLDDETLDRIEQRAIGRGRRSRIGATE
jgi:hypothetical protein